MKRIGEFGCLAVLGMALFATGCQKNQSTAQTSTDTSSTATDTSSTATDTSATATDTSSGNPADGNLASADQQAAPAPADQTSDQYGGDSDYDTDQQAVYASQPPPALPDYSQPPCPGDNYMWTPGYWNYTSAGYYWVPGTWVLAPYVGALWTPPYWGFEGGRYRLHHGYWGQHIGFYGGINYGFGYVGRGYYGGYWNNGRFDYNRSVMNVNGAVVHNVYSRNVANPGFDNNRISYNGGNGGVRVQPTAAERAVLHEHIVPPVRAQVQHVQQAAGNRAQFVKANGGHPAQLAAARPLATAYHAPAAAPPAQPRAAVGNRPNAANPGARPEARPAPAARPGAAQPRNEARPAAQPRTAARPATAQPRTEARPAAQPRTAARPAAQPRTEARPAAQPKAASHPAPQTRPAQKTQKTNTKDTEHH